MTIQGGRIQFSELAVKQENGQKSGVKVYIGPAAILGFFARIFGKASYCTIKSKQYCYDVKSMRQFLDRNQILPLSYPLNKTELSSIVDKMIQIRKKKGKGTSVLELQKASIKETYKGPYLTDPQEARLGAIGCLFSSFKEQFLTALSTCGLSLRLEERGSTVRLNGFVLTTILNADKQHVVMTEETFSKSCVAFINSKAEAEKSMLLDQIRAASTNTTVYPSEIRKLLLKILEDNRPKTIN